VASDYERITSENIRKRGEEFDDIGRFLAEQLYSDRTHFVYELLQNAEDALGRRLRSERSRDTRGVAFQLFRDRLELRHFGEPFDEDDVRAICDVLKGTKTDDAVQIGRFGIGFKSVYAYTASPEVHSGSEHFRIERYIRPSAVPARQLAHGETLFVLPFDHPDVLPDEAFEQIRDRLASLDPRTLLFLRNVDEVSWNCETAAGGTYLREDKEERDARRVTVIGERNTGSKVDEEEWLVFERPVLGSEGSGASRVEVAFRMERDQETAEEKIVSARDSKLVVFFPTEKETHLGFLVQGPYRTTPARDNINDDDWNRRLVEETAALIAETLPKIRDRGLLTASFLQVLPTQGAYFAPGSTFRPVFEEVKNTLKIKELLPTQSGFFVSARSAKLARTAGLRELISDEQLGQLHDGRQLRWLPSEITYDRTPGLRQYLISEIGIEEIEPEMFARRLDAAFTANQTDDWMIRFYTFLDDQKALWQPQRWRRESAVLRTKPFIRLENLSHVPPFWGDGVTPRAFLSIENETSLPTVRREVSKNEQARRFLINLGLTEPNIVDEVIEEILPKYRQPDAEARVTHSEHERDIRKIMYALKDASGDKQERLANTLRATPFLLANNPATGSVAFQNPSTIYLRSPKLELYFEGNPSAWFLEGGYDDYERDLSRLGVLSEVRVTRMKPSSYGVSAGHVVIQQEHGWHVRGLDGFDPGCEIDGLLHALENINTEKASYIWNELLLLYSRHVRGTIESATRQNFENSERKDALSMMGTLVTENSWLPERNGELRKPAELGLEDLPDGFAKNEGLGEALGMRPSDVTLLADRLGVRSKDIDFMVRHREEFEEFKRQFEESRQASQTGSEQNGTANDENNANLDFAQELQEIFAKPGTERRGDPPLPSGPVGSPELRRERTQEEIERAKLEEPEPEQRFVRVPRKIWERKDLAVRTFLREQYDGECQICAQAFPKRNGEPYFEGLYLVSSTKARWVNRVGNILCLCATCCAKLQHGAVEAEDILEQVESYRTEREGGYGEPALHLRLCGEPEKIRFSERHMIDLQEIIEHPNGDASVQ
jgi:hypothetical protein